MRHCGVEVDRFLGAKNRRYGSATAPEHEVQISITGAFVQIVDMHLLDVAEDSPPAARSEREHFPPRD
jgi:hypothetical protein